MTINIHRSVLDGFIRDIDPELVDKIAKALFLSDTGWTDSEWSNGQLGPQQHHFWRSQAYLAILIGRNPGQSAEHMTNVAAAAADRLRGQAPQDVAP